MATPELSLRGYVFLIGLPGVGAGTAVGVYEINFWFAIGLGALCTLWLLADWVYVSRVLRWYARLPGIALCLVVLGFIGWLVVRPMPMSISILPEAGNFPPETEVGGIKWKPEYSGARILLVNNSYYDYANLNIGVVTNLFIAEAGVRGHEECKTFPANQFGTAITEATIVRDGQTLKIPATQAYSKFFRIHCASMEKRTQVEIVLALVNAYAPRPGESVLPNTPMIGATVEPNIVELGLQYEVGARTYEKENMYCGDKQTETQCEDAIEKGAAVLGYWKATIP